MFFDILQPKIFFIFLFFYFQFLNFVNGILAGEEIDWNRNGFVVKVLAREGPNAPTKSCTGSLISASLVLTSGDCVVDRSTKESLNEFVVFVSKPSDKELRSTGKLLERNEQNGWALLRIAPQNITELCPPSPAPKWVARLNFRPLLTSGPRLEVSQADLSSGEGAVCFFVGFTTTEKGKKLLKIFLKFYFLAEDFLNENRLLRIYLDKLEKPPKDDGLNQYRSDVYSGFTACYPYFFIFLMSSDSEIDVVGVEEEQNPTTSSRVKKAYSIEKKIEVIEFAKKNSNHAAARRFGVSRSSVIDWRAQEGKLRESKRINKRLPGGGRSLRFMESDEQLANWVRERRKEKVRVTRRMIQQQAIKMFPLVTKENIINSFKYCGLTNKTNGAEDDEIHCFKINGPVSEGRAQLRQARLDNELAKIFEEIDLEEDDDTGAPLLCKLSKYQDPALQLGIFQSLTVPGGKAAKDDEQNDKSNKTIDELNKCKLATQMRFNLFNADESLAKAIEKYALTEFVSVYHECGF
uniref:HTH CENPB-type domain-containing protein n=1 Tax=Meloidogyne enterolobii TaxID=390850 RepID=A0A6V7WV99_MELEN|nr:unnamed protein product [Meloidogyne enterolobii]